MPSYTFPGVPATGLFAHLTRLVQAAEAADFDLVTVMDHFYQIRGVGPETEPMLEAYSTLAALSAHTQRVRLGTLVTGVTYRNPALLAKMVTTLDVVSGGRALLGIGAAWNADEHAGYGIPFPAVRERMDRLDEALSIARLMFTEERPSFSGRYYHIDGALNSPRPLQAGGPRILIGGGGEKRTLLLAATHADLTHWNVASVDEFKHKSGVLEDHCETVGRNPQEITRTIGVPVELVANASEARAAATGRRGQPVELAAPERAAQVLGEYVAAGAGGFMFRNPNLTTPELLAAAGEVKRLLA
ncbi:MAG: LLM class F420-dependent oxidoreductase [Chloroflexi bacterium]|nr:LLM class F420-dependent oxidoreductase [Chloroflexota bacterium]